MAQGAELLPTWMRRALFFTAVMNILVAGAFLPSAGALRELAGMPAGGPSVYLLTVGLFILLFGFGYLWSAITGRAERLFIALAAAGKLSFVGLLAGLWVARELPGRAPLVAGPDLIFAALFLIWLFGSRAPGLRPAE